MPNIRDITPEQRFLGLFVGRSGGGKSVAAYSFPKPLKVFDLDGRIRGGIAVPWNAGTDIDYEYYPPMVPGKSKDTQGALATYQKLNTAFETLLTEAQSGFCKYKTIVLDSITWMNIDLLLDAIPMTHEARGGGKKLGTMNMAGPEDYGFQATGTYQVLAFLKSLRIPNIIVTAHIVNKWGKPPGDDNKFANNVIVGEQLSLTDKLAENVPSSFDHVFEFMKYDSGARVNFKFSAQGELARTAFPIPYGEHDITGKNFYETMMGYAAKSAPQEVANK